MNKSFRPAILAAFVAAAAATPAFAEGDGGDNGMSPWYGDSWSNVQSHAPEATAVPSLQAQEERGPALQAWGHTRDNVRARTARVRESTSNAFHRMTGTAVTRDDAAVGTVSGGTVTTDTSGSTLRGTTTTGTMSSGTTGTMSSGTTSRSTTTSRSADAPDPQAAPAAHSGEHVAPGPLSIDAGIRAQQRGQVNGTAADQAGPLGSGSNTGTVDPTGVGAATMGGSPYGGNQDPARLPSSGSSDVTPRGR